MLYAFSHKKIECCLDCPLFTITWNEMLEMIKDTRKTMPNSGLCLLENEYVYNKYDKMDFCPLISEDGHGNFKLERF